MTPHHNTSQPTPRRPSASSRSGLPPRTLLACAAGWALMAVAQAQTATPTPVAAAAPSTAASAATADTALQKVVITGQAANLRNALDAQQAADNIVSVLSADGIGQLPDINAAEALQRLPGVSVERDQGEGRYVDIRGLGSDLNSVTINGALVPAPDADRRGIAMDVLPAGLIRTLEVSKTLTPDQDANAIGGSVEVKTLSGFDHPGRFVSVETGLSHDSDTDHTTPRAGLIFSDRLLGDTLGVAAGLSFDRRRYGSNDVETGGEWNGDAIEEFERRRYTLQRDRTAAMFNLDWRPQNGQKYWLESFFSRFTDHEKREAQTISFDSAQAAGTLGEASATRELKERTEIQSIASLVLGTEQALSEAWKLKATLGTSRATDNEPLYVRAASFDSNDSFSDVSFTDTERPRLNGPSSLYSANNYSLSSVKLSRMVAADRETHGTLDFTHPWTLDSLNGKLQFGAKLSQRHKTSDEDAWKIKASKISGDLGMSAFTAGTVDYAWGDFGPGLSLSTVKNRIAGMDLSNYEDATGSAENDYSVRERIAAGYVMSSLDGDDWRLLGGIRFEGTRTQARGAKVEDDTLTPLDVTTSRGAWLPSLQWRQDLDRRTSLRAAFTTSVVRPTFAQLSPGTVIDGDEATFGNPDLKPWRSNNFDLGVERRIDRDAAVSAYVFRKQIRDFIYQTDLAGTGEWADYSQAETYANGSHAHVTGLELSWSQALRSLPSPFNGLIVGVNATWVASQAAIGTGGQSRNIPLPSQSDRVMNLMLGYETGPWSVRLSVNHKSPYLLEVDDVNDKQQDQYVDTQTQLDLSTRWQLNRQWQLSMEVQNLTAEPYYVYEGSHHRNVQYEQYGRTLRLGLKWTSF